MNREHGEAILYDAETNSAFRDALIDLLIAPALARAMDLHKDARNATIMCDEEIQYESSRAAYDFYAEKGSPHVAIGVTVFTGLEELSDAAIAMVAGEIAVSDLSETMRANLSDETLLRAATIEFFVHHEFGINLQTSTVVVRNTMGMAVNGRKIEAANRDKEPVSVLDIERQALFESRELVELFRALHALELVTDTEVRNFLEAF